MAAARAVAARAWVEVETVLEVGAKAAVAMAAETVAAETVEPQREDEARRIRVQVSHDV